VEYPEDVTNNKGVWVVGNARNALSGSFSATVQLLTATANIAGACAYASNYPPMANYNGDVYVFTGTPMYDITLKHTDGSKTHTQSGSPFFVPSNYTLFSFTDKTDAPGKINCIPMTGNINFSVPTNLPKGQGVSFAVTENPSMPNAAMVTYTWSAQGFNPASFAGAYNVAYTPTTPGTAGTYPMTLTARSEGYCELSVT
jgi:hypothetical protein